MSRVEYMGNTNKYMHARTPHVYAHSLEREIDREIDREIKVGSFARLPGSNYYCLHIAVAR